MTNTPKARKPKLDNREAKLKDLVKTAEGYAATMKLWATKGVPLRKPDGGPLLDSMGRQLYRGMTAPEAKQVADFLARHPLAELVRGVNELTSTDRLELEAARRRVQGQRIDEANTLGPLRLTESPAEAEIDE